MNAVATIQTQTFSVGEVKEMARAIAACGLFGVKTPDQAFGLMLIAQAEGRHPATIAQEYDIIQGRPALKSQSALARFQHAGGKIQWIETTATRAAAVLSHPLGGETEFAWDMKRAADAGLTGKDNWRKFPAQMLRARVVAEGVRAIFPACLNGMYLAEEVQDFDAPRTDRKAPPAGLRASDEVAAEHSTEAIDQLDPVEIDALVSDLLALKFPRDGYMAIMRDTPKYSMNREQFAALEAERHAIMSRNHENETTTEGDKG